MSISSPRPAFRRKAAAAYLPAFGFKGVFSALLLCAGALFSPAVSWAAVQEDTLAVAYSQEDSPRLVTSDIRFKKVAGCLDISSAKATLSLPALRQTGGEDLSAKLEAAHHIARGELMVATWFPYLYMASTVHPLAHGIVLQCCCYGKGEHSRKAIEGLLPAAEKEEMEKAKDFAAKDGLACIYTLCIIDSRLRELSGDKLEEGSIRHWDSARTVQAILGAQDEGKALEGLHAAIEKETAELVELCRKVRTVPRANELATSIGEKATSLRLLRQQRREALGKVKLSSLAPRLPEIPVPSDRALQRELQRLMDHLFFDSEGLRKALLP